MHKPDCQCPPCRFRRGQKGQTSHFTVRLPADMIAWLRARPEGARAYLEAAVAYAMSQEAESAPKE